VDLRHEALLHAGEVYHDHLRRLASILSVNFPLTPLQNSLGVAAELRGERWQWLRDSQNRSTRKILLLLLPLVSGFNPTQHARDGCRHIFAQRKAKKRSSGRRPAQIESTEITDATEIHSDSALPSAYQSSLEDQANARLEAQRLIREARKRWSARGEQLLTALAQEATIDQAAAEGKISQATAYRWLRALSNFRTT